MAGQRPSVEDAATDRIKDRIPIHSPGQSERGPPHGLRPSGSTSIREPIIKRIADQVLEVTAVRCLSRPGVGTDRAGRRLFCQPQALPERGLLFRIIYQAMRFPVDAFPCCLRSRTSGWIAQWEEMLQDSDQKIARPRKSIPAPICGGRMMMGLRANNGEQWPISGSAERTGLGCCGQPNPCQPWKRKPDQQAAVRWLEIHMVRRPARGSSRRPASERVATSVKYTTCLIRTWPRRRPSAVQCGFPFSRAAAPQQSHSGMDAIDGGRPAFSKPPRPRASSNMPEICSRSARRNGCAKACAR